MRPFTRAFAPSLAEGSGENVVRLFGIVLAIKYAGLSVAVIGLLAKNAAGSRGLSRYPALLWMAMLCAIPAAVALVRWIRRGRPTDGIFAMAAIFVHAVMLMLARGHDFANHFLLQAIIGLIGMLAAARQRTGEGAGRAWAPMAWLGIAVWGLAGFKKFISGSFLNGEFLAFLVNEPATEGFPLLTRAIVGGGRASVPVQCCFDGHVAVSQTAAYVLIAAGIGMALAEVSPVFVAMVAPRKVVGWLMYALAVVATSIANEMDFGLVLIALAALWGGEGRGFRRLTILTAIGMSGGYLWRVLR